jgi:GDP-4-dehydro-6-deoxy-D-mannose reductase
MRALVTGQAGFAGQHLTRLLQEEGIGVVGYNQGDGRDVRDFECVRECLVTCDPDLVFHLAAQPSPSESWVNPRRAHDVIAGGALVLLEALRHTASDARVLLVGSEAEYGTALRARRASEDDACWPVSPYAVAKLAATHYARTYADRYGLHVVVVRPSYHTGPGQFARQAISAFARRIALVEAGRRSHLDHGDLSSARAILDVRDVVAAYRAAVDLPPGVYNVSADRVVTMRDVVAMLVSFSQVNVPLKPRGDLVVGGDSTPWHAPSHERLTGACGWTPTIPLYQTLADLLDFWRART